MFAFAIRVATVLAKRFVEASRSSKLISGSVFELKISKNAAWDSECLLHPEPLGKTSHHSANSSSRSSRLFSDFFSGVKSTDFFSLIYISFFIVSLIVSLIVSHARL